MIDSLETIITADPSQRSAYPGIMVETFFIAEAGEIVSIYFRYAPQRKTGHAGAYEPQGEEIGRSVVEDGPPWAKGKNGIEKIAHYHLVAVRTAAAMLRVA